ncbi:MAG: efflux RND transporter permease subunit, partial [Armatimonadota bacterium]
MQLTKLAISRPVVILMLFLALIVLGWKARSTMTVDLYPNVDFPMAFIMTTYQGAGPEEIETLVTKPIEDNVISVSGLKNLTSSSQEGVSSVSLEFELGTEMISTMADVRSKIDAVKMMLPADASSPVVQKIDIGAVPVITLGLSSSRPAKELRELADETIKDRLSKIKGVASVSVTGGDIREIQLNISKNRLEAYGISINQITQALMTDNMNMPSGKITEGSKDYSVRTMGEFLSIDEIRALKISVPGGPMGTNRILTIGEIADVKDTVAEREVITRLQKKDSVGILVLKQSDANTIGVADAVKEELEKMNDVLPSDVDIAVSYDQSDSVKESMADVNVSLMLGALLAVLIVFLFLHNIRGTIIVAIAIPTSMIAAFIPISFAGFTMNMMVMLALSLAVGILVDDSIVVLENIYRHLDKGESPAEAALNGRNEIGLAAVTITMVDVVVFVPIAFMGGIVGMFFREFGITVAVATLFSLLVSFTLTPMMASRWYKQNEHLESKKGFFKKFDEGYQKVDNGYRRILGWALQHRVYVLLIGVITLSSIIALAMVKAQGEFFPKVDSGQVVISVDMPAGTSLTTTDSVVMQVEERVAKIAEVKNVFSTIGATGAGVFGSGNQGANYAQVTVALTQKESVGDKFLATFSKKFRKRIRTDEDVAQEIRELVADIPGGRITAKIQAGMGGGGSPIDLELTSTNIDEMNNVSQKMREAIASVPGIVNADVSWKVGKPEIRVNVDKLKASNMGLSMAQIAAAMRTSVAGNTDSKFRQNGKEYDIRVQLREFDRYKLDDVKRIVVGTYNGMSVYLQDIAEISDSTGPTKIDRKNRQRKVSVTTDFLPGYKLTTMQKLVAEKIAA